jgi:hypothetical protein
MRPINTRSLLACAFLAAALVAPTPGMAKQHCTIYYDYWGWNYYGLQHLNYVTMLPDTALSKSACADTYNANLAGLQQWGVSFCADPSVTLNGTADFLVMRAWMDDMDNKDVPKVDWFSVGPIDCAPCGNPCDRCILQNRRDVLENLASTIDVRCSNWDYVVAFWILSSPQIWTDGELSSVLNTCAAYCR